MIIARSPLRISLGGGGTDLPSYYSQHGGFLVAAAINQYVYVTFQSRYIYAKEILLRYSQIERVASAEGIQHPIIREVLRMLDIRDQNIEISSFADIPAGTGLGSSGSFTTALVKAAHKFKNAHVTPEELARLSAHIEIDRLAEPVGKQDQYIAAYGGLTVFEFLSDGRVQARPLRVTSETLYHLEDNLLLFATGITRNASSILKEQDDKSRAKDHDMVENLHVIKDLGVKSCQALESGDLAEFARLMNVHWEHKKKRSQGMSSGDIDRWYRTALDNGALGGKLIGAGGGGFLMFYAPEPSRLRAAMAQQGLMEMRFTFDFEGTKLL